MHSYCLLLHTESFRGLQDYRAGLAAHGLAQAGGRLRADLRDQDVASLSDEAFLEHLVNTKSPRIFAESAVHGDGRDWNSTELTLLGDLGIAMAVCIFDDGHHRAPQVHEQPLTGTLLFIPGAPSVQQPRRPGGGLGDGDPGWAYRSGGIWRPL